VSASRRAAPDRPTTVERTPWIADRVATPGTKVHGAIAIGTGLVIASLLCAAVLAGAGLLLVHVGPVTRWDDRVNSWFASHRTPAWNNISYWGTYLANTLGIVVVAAVATAGLLLRRWGRQAFMLACALAVELTVFLTVNYSVGRPRPSVPHLGSTPSTYSFPSGHCAATLVLYGGIAVLVWSRTRSLVSRAVTAVGAVLFPLWVAFSRVYRGQHHPTDVFAGLCMGLAVLLAVAWLFTVVGADRAEETR
jgi:undecaprenyl-diphosphatase